MEIDNIIELNNEALEMMIYEVRGVRVMLDFELSSLLGYDTKRFNEQVGRNIDLISPDSRFKLSKNEFDDILKFKYSNDKFDTLNDDIDTERSKFATANATAKPRITIAKRRTLPYAFTENGVKELASFLKARNEIGKRNLIFLNVYFNNISKNNLIVNEEKWLSDEIKSKIYFIRGERVMLDFELAEIYGYSTKVFNQQVKNNEIKFPERYRFQLSLNEINSILRSKNLTSSWGGNRRKPYAFTEQGIYMLMTVLNGELAIRQSIALIDTFKSMKDYIIENGNLQVNTNQYLESRFASYDNRFKTVENKLDIVMDNFVDENKLKHFVFLDGQRVEADIAYQTIYKMAKCTIFIVDDYIDIKTLELLKVCECNIKITIFSDNKAKNNLTKSFINDFIKDSNFRISFKNNNGIIHDRYIFIDFYSSNRIMYHCGASSKDAGGRVNTIMHVGEVEAYEKLVERIFKNGDLEIK